MENRIVGLVEQMEELVDRGVRVPLTGKVMIEESIAQNILEDLRRSVPEDVKNARIIMDDRDRILAEAHGAAKTIMDQARKQADLLLEENTIARKGQEQAETMVRQAQQYHMEMKEATLLYSNKLLQDLEDRLSLMLRNIQSNREELAEQVKDRDTGQ